VAPDSQTETFVALKLFSRQLAAGRTCPFYLRTGKCLPQQASEISIQFRAVAASVLSARSLARLVAVPAHPRHPAASKGIVLGFQAKYPGRRCSCGRWTCSFQLSTRALAAPSPDAYETLLWDVMKKDATLFMRADQVEAAWQLLMPVLGSLAVHGAQRFPNYRCRHLGTGEYARTCWLPDIVGPCRPELVTTGKNKGKSS